MPQLAPHLCCPRCAANLQRHGETVQCTACEATYPVTEGIAQLFVANDWDADQADITEAMKAFYEETPFPNYDDFDDVQSLVAKAGRGLFARLLHEQIPGRAHVLECGCGTGQLSNFLSVAGRTVVGADMCLNSLSLAETFRRTNQLDSASFVQMNLFRPAFAQGSFDWVVCNGVLHHTSNPKGGFESIARLVKPGGYILIGLYHTYGRLLNDVRRGLMWLTKDRARFIDGRLNPEGQSPQKLRAWFADQYRNPHESKHTIAEAMGWLREAGFDFVKSIPHNGLGRPFDERSELTEPDPVVSGAERWLKELSMTFSHADDGGLFVVIGRRR